MPKKELKNNSENLFFIHQPNNLDFFLTFVAFFSGCEKYFFLFLKNTKNCQKNVQFLGLGGNGGGGKNKNSAGKKKN